MRFRREFPYAAASVLAFVVAVGVAVNEPLPKGKGYGGGSRSYSSSKTTISKLNGNGGSNFPGHLLGLCEPLPSPKNGGISCSSSARRMTCTATCMKGFEFSDKSAVKKNSCNNNEGTWPSDVEISDCEPVCHPPCDNGGQCFGRNRCVCTPRYRGETCQFPVTNCNGERFHQTGGYSCNHTSEETLCTISCAPGMEFDYPPAAVYTCDLIGNWLPKYAPKCVQMDVIVHTLPSITVSPFKETKLVSLEPKEGVCSTWGQLHYRTFDGTLYSGQGKCTYLLAKDCASNTFNIHVQNDARCNNVLDCYRRVIIFINNDKYTLENSGNGPQVYWGSNRIKTPTTINGLLLEEVAHYVVVNDWRNCIECRFKSEEYECDAPPDSVSIEVNPKLVNKTCGLCGRYDGDPSNDLSMLDGTVTDNIASFVNSWKMNDLGESCPDSAKMEHACTYDSVEKKQISDKGSEICRQIFLKEYSSCHALVDAQRYYDMCRMDFCTCGSNGDSCMCSSLSKYFQECHRLGGMLLNGWRKANFCPFECSGDMVYRDCGSSCPLSCKKALQECADEQCVDGCHCPQGTILHGDKCILPKECPCHHAGKTYANGKSIQRDCNTCKCDGGDWKCTKEKCESRCSAIGDPHYTTFDGKHYNFMGKCSYYLIYNDDYSVEQENVACSGAISESMSFIISPSSGYPSCTKSLTIRIRGTVLRLKQRKEVVLDGKDVYELPITAPGVYVYAASSIFIKVELDNNLTVTWDGISRVYVDAPLSFLGNTKGLCGTFNYNQKDDFLTGEGDIEPDVNAFANKWKTSDECHDLAVGESLRDPCDLYSQRQQKSEALCGRLKSVIFSVCHDVVDPEPFYKNCVYDMCYCQSRVMSCLCPAISDYAAECAKKNVLVDWRSSVRECGINCPGGQVYQICGSSCKRSCVDISFHPNCREQCIEGCNCPPGTTLDQQGECIAVSNCLCRHGGRDYSPGHKDIRGNLACECSGAKWNCRPATKDELTESYNSSNIESKPLCSAAANMEYTDCASDCPTTCKNMHAPPKCNTQICKHGCRCQKGYVLDTKSSSCVRITQCPCHHGGQSYSEGETIKEDCNTCVCEGGMWSCEKNVCPGICSAWGESHFKTFDGRVFEFHGDCDYVLARDGDSKWEMFQVTLHNVPCGTSDVTCSKSLTLNIGDEKVTLTSEKPLPSVLFGSRYILRVVGLYVFIHTDIGITLQWDRITRVYVRADSRWKDKVQGLCGNFNDNENDDFKTSDGGPPVAMATVFGDSWRIHNYCPVSKLVENTCDLHPHRKSWAAQKCSILKSSTFKSCHSEVPFEPYLERCIFDSCGCDMGGDCDCFCTAVAAYAQECNGHGIPIEWRSQELCPIQCDPGTKYVPCMSVCPKLTCKTQYLYAEVEETCGREVCVEGCESLPCQQPDQMYNNDQQFECIAKSSCVAQPCRVLNGTMYYEGEKVKDPNVADPCQSCHCRAGDIVCVGKKCADTTVLPPSTEIWEISSVPPYPAGEATAVCEHGWSNWMNGFSPNYKNGGDYETFDLLQKRKFTFCPTGNMQDIECRTAGTHKHYKETGQVVECSLYKGLVCENRDQPVIKLCNDFEIRVYCKCEQETTATETRTTETTPMSTTMTTMMTTSTPFEVLINPPVTCDNVGNAVDGWTPWMNANSPDANPNGDIETRDVLRTRYSFCADEYVTNLECREVGSNVSFAVAGQYGVVCDLNHGLKCLHSMQASRKCNDYEVRFYCLFNCNNESVTYSPSTSTGTPVFVHNQTKICSGWTEWFNRDSPADDGNDREELYSIPDFATMCPEPVSYQCRNARTKEPFRQTAGQQNFIEPCNSKGFVCESRDGRETCEDYEIRVYCSCLIPSGNLVNQCTPGWTNWFDTDDPKTGEGDFEEIEDISQAFNTCDTELITKIECQARLVGSKQAAAANASVTAPTPKGVSELSSWVDYTESGDVGVKCSTLTGLACYNGFQPKRRKCRDYRIRYYCSCGSLTTTTTTTAVETPTTTVTVSSTTTTTALCMPGMVWSDCAYRCDQMCQSFLHQSIKRNLCGRGKNAKTCIPGCIERECRPPYVWRDESTCVKPEECTCLTNDGQLIPPGEIVDMGACERCHCIATDLDCVVTKFCSSIPGNLTETTGGEYTSTASTQSPTLITIEQDDCWTAWINTDSPNATASDSGDIEDLSSIRARFSFCADPIAIDCRVAKTKQSYSEAGQTVECDRHDGLLCWNRLNWDKSGCYDYEVRFFCPCAATVSSTQATTFNFVPFGIVTANTICDEGYTSWFSSHVPDQDGEYESIQNIRMTGNRFCANEHITAMECRVKGTDIPHYKSNDSLVTCNVLEGLSCDSRLQNHGCLDYEVRFYCQCESTTTEATITASMTTTTSSTSIPPVTVTTVTMMTSLPPCSYWSNWINDDKPWMGIGDVEMLKPPTSFCKDGVMQDIECVLENSNVPYNETEGRRLECSLKKGFVCKNKYQPNKMCHDYKIRYFCACRQEIIVESTTMVIPTGTTIVVVPPPSTSPGIQPCDSYYYLISGYRPIDDSSLQASSSLNSSYGPQSSRITDASTRVWMAAQKDVKGQYIQVDLGRPQLVFGVATQGDPRSPTWVTSYNVLYGVDGNSFSYVSEVDGSVLAFTGNYDSNTVVKNVFRSPVEARFVRVLPLTWEGTISLRFDVLGCSLFETTTAYTTEMPTTTTTTGMPTTFTSTIPVCSDEMGLENGVLPDEQMTASSIYDAKHGPDKARLNGVRNWSPKTLDRSQFLQIDFRDIRVISGVSTQGRSDVSQWVTSYYVSYSTDGVIWSNATDGSGQTEVYAGNYDGQTVVTNHFDQAIRARYLRIFPQTWHNWIALRTEIKGCFEAYPTTASTAAPTLTTPTTTTQGKLQLECDLPMGMEDGQITDEMITVTSSLSGKLTGGERARLNMKETGSSSSGWIAAITDDQYLMVDFREPRNLSGVVIQGRENRGEWVKKYKVLYSTDGKQWYEAKDENGNDIFAGNTDDSGAVAHMFENIFSARFVKIIPTEWKGWISMRLEIIGCIAEPEVTESTMTTSSPSTVSQSCLGSLNENIPWDQIEVSSSLAGLRSGAPRLALNTREGENTGGWVAGQSDKGQFVIVDYGKPVNITGIVTQGRNKHPEWVTEYRVYTSLDKVKWVEATDETGNTLISGNEDSDTPVQHSFDRSINARYLKVVPNKWKDWISIRLDVLGCPPPIEPKIPKGCQGSLNANVTWDQIEVSSSLAGLRSGAPRLTLNTLEAEDTGGWVAGQSDLQQFVIVDYNKPVNITGIVTQGRNKHPEWVTEYRVYTSQDKIKWLVAADETGNTLISGNEDSDTPVQHFFEHPMNGRYVKIVPYQWKDWISMRLDVRGCPSSPPPPPPEYCYEYGPWLSLSVPSPVTADSDIEPINDLIASSNVCSNPVQIECRETTSKKPYDQTGQTVSCDLTRGLRCESADQKTGYVGNKCYNYEARIVCWTCGVTTSTGKPHLKAPPCPEVPLYSTGSCPDSCPLGYVCDGTMCVDPSFCPCVRNGKFYNPGERFTNSDCEECVCKLNGHSYCIKKSCPLCSYGQPGNLNASCECDCKRCAEDELMCNTNQYCLHKDLWCDGLVDCPDDEKDCSTSSPPTSTSTTTSQPSTTTCPSDVPPTCLPGTSLVLKDPAAVCPTYVCGSVPIPTLPPPKKDFCEISGSYFQTFDGYGYKYEICDHVLLQDSIEGNFKVTLIKNCSSNTGQCWKRLNVTQDDHVVLVDEHLRVGFDGTVYNDAQLIKIGRKKLGLAIRVVGESAVIKSQKHAFEVHFNVDHNLRIDVGTDLLNKINGLCGRYSGNSDDDLEMSNGNQAITVAEFGDSWGKHGGEQCKSKVCPADVMAKAIAACNQLKTPPFDACHAFVDPAYPIQTCAESVCDCVTNMNFTEKDCHCKAYLPYVEACEIKGVAKIRYWRVKQSCLPSCPPGLVWMDCGSDCERTCDNLQDDHNAFQQVEDTSLTLSSSSASGCDSERCVAGCFCPVGLVRKGDHCVQPQKCQDCICKGYGDPHYFTFDGHYFQFQGNCTYILAQDIIAPGQQGHKFEVFATNEDCHEEPMTTCTVAIMVLFNGHTAQFRVNESVTFDGVQLYYSDFPFHAYGIHIESIPGRSITFSVPDIYLEVRYFELNYGFEVRLPSEIYYNKTEGLCGNCNFDENDDFRCPYDRVTNDTNEFGFSWIAKPPEAFESTNEICKLKVEVDKCKPTVEEGLCDRILSDEFLPCHGLVDPQVYVSACRFDVCHSISPMASLCRSVTEYARKCAENGICIQNWRKTDFCHYECPVGMYFDQCGPACPKSCKDVHNGWALDARRHGKDIAGGHLLEELEEEEILQKQTLQELVDVCDTAPVDGCFCIGGKIFHNGSCVDQIFCEICDTVGHKVGDTWQTDSCKTCTCSMTQTVECVKTTCPSKPICNEGQSLKMVKAANGTCCDIYDCVTNVANVSCPTADLAQCNKGEVIRIKKNKEGCPRYVCECDVSECPPVHTPTQLELGEVTSIDKSGCCQVLKIVCRKDKCPEEPLCGKNRQLRERQNSKSRCCKEYYCEALPNVCLYVHEFEVVNGQENKLKPGNRVSKYYKPGDVWTDGFCRRCTCEIDGNQLTRHRCTIELCPQLNDYQDKNEYEWHTEIVAGACCPKYTRRACVDVNGNKYSFGEEWASPDGDKCKSYRCGTADNGDAIIVQRTVKCIKDCKIGAEYVEPVASSSQCCGTCEPVGCVEDGHFYKVGSVWNSTTHPCTTAECIKLEGVIKTRFNSKVCKPVLKGCSQRIRDADGCCDICNGTMTYESLQTCVPKKVNSTKTERIFELFHGGVHCQNSQPILDLLACVGHCESSSIYSSGKHDFLSFCHCCAPKGTEKKTILLDCTDGLKRPIEYSQPTDCTCSPCGQNFNQTSGVQLNNIY